MGKISEFTKAELLKFMQENGEIHRYNESSHSWKRAFELCRADGYPNYEMDCPKCADKVKEWLQKP